MGILHKRENRFNVAEEKFGEVLAKIKSGKKFLTNEDETTVRFEMGLMLDGQNKLEAALNEFQYVKNNAPTLSYYAWSASFQVARTHLALWLASPKKDELHLEAADKGFDLWLETNWHNEPMKIWGYYHQVCVQREKIRLGQSTGETKQSQVHKLNEVTKGFREAASMQKGPRLYELRYTAFFLTSDAYQHFPGEAVKCGLDDLLEEFKIR